MLIRMAALLAIGAVTSQAQQAVAIDSVLKNYEGGYEYWPSHPSPIIYSVEHFWKEIAGGGYVCGPALSYKKGNTKWEGKAGVSETGFDAKLLPDGWALIKSGPEAAYSRFGSGECGACPWANLEIWAIDPQGELKEALTIGQGTRQSVHG